jgi:NitT/TauT family transport system ATP-binding protein
MEPHATRRPDAAALALHGVGRTFAGRPPVRALGGIDLSIASGDFVAVLGPSGCGKSTLLRILAGLDEADEGGVVRDPARGSESRGGDIAYVFQEPHLLPWRDVVDNVALPLELLGVGPLERRRKALAAIGEVGLRDAATRYPAQLSGGMRMRVSLARAMITEPRLLLLDEPFAAVDEITRQALDDMLRSMWSATGVTVVFVTHSIVEAAYLARRAVVFSRRPGRIVLDHTLDLPEQRTPELRTEAAFAEQTGILLRALEQGAAG